MLTVTVEPKVTLPDLAGIEAVAAQKLPELRAQREVVEGLLVERLGELAASTPEEKAAVAEIRKEKRKPAPNAEVIAVRRKCLAACAEKMREKIEAMRSEQPKLVDQQTRGKLGTLQRLDREIALYEGLVEAAQRVAKKAPEQLFEVRTRPWGNRRSRIFVTIIDEDLLTLRKAGVLGV